MEGPDAAKRRPDFGLAEMRVGADLYYAQHDNRSTGEVVYRLRIREVAPDRLVVATENVSPVRYLFVPLAGAGDLEAGYFLERLTPGTWGYYGLVRVGAGASSLLGGHRSRTSTGPWRSFATWPGWRRTRSRRRPCRSCLPCPRA